MRKILFIAMLSMIALHCKSQSIPVPNHEGVFYNWNKNNTIFEPVKSTDMTIQAALNATITQNDIDVTTKTTPNSITPPNVGNQIDDLCNKLLTFFGLHPTSLLDWQTVVNNGSTINNTGGNVGTVSLVNTGDLASLRLKNLGGGLFAITMDDAAANQIFEVSNAGQLNLYDATGVYGVTIQSLAGAGNTFIALEFNNHVARILSDLLTSSINCQIPDENGSTAATANTLVTHTTKDPIIVSDGTNEGFINVSQFGLKEISSGYQLAGGTLAGGIPYLQVHSAGTAFGALIKANGLTAGHIFNLPDHSGTILTNSTGTATTSLSGVTTWVVTHGLGYAPSNVIIQAANGAMANVLLTGYWIDPSSITTTQFTISFPTPITAASVNITWQAF